MSALAIEIAGLELRAMTDPGRDPQGLLEELFTLRHRLLTVLTMAAQGRVAYARMAKLTRLLPAPAPARSSRTSSTSSHRSATCATGRRSSRTARWTSTGRVPTRR